MSVSIALDDVRALIDMALSGDAACSGHLDDEEVETLRRVATAAGLDPLLATPLSFQCRYIGAHDMGEWGVWHAHRDGGEFRYRMCRRCRLSHQEEERRP